LIAVQVFARTPTPAGADAAGLAVTPLSENFEKVFFRHPINPSHKAHKRPFPAFGCQERRLGGSVAEGLCWVAGGFVESGVILQCSCCKRNYSAAVFYRCRKSGYAFPEHSIAPAGTSTVCIVGIASASDGECSSCLTPIDAIADTHPGEESRLCSMVLPLLPSRHPRKNNNKMHAEQPAASLHPLINQTIPCLPKPDPPVNAFRVRTLKRLPCVLNQIQITLKSEVRLADFEFGPVVFLKAFCGLYHLTPFSSSGHFVHSISTDTLTHRN